MKNFDRSKSEAAEPEPGIDVGVPSAEWTNGSALATKASTVGLYAAIVAGVLALILVLTGFGSAAPAATSKHTGQGAANVEAGVGEYASRYVTTWLRSTRDDHKALAQFVDVPGAAELPVKPFEVADPAVSGIRAVDKHLWSVTIAASVTGRTAEGKSGAKVRRYFQVTVSQPSPSAFAAVALPAPVAGPAGAEAPSTDYSLHLSNTDPVWASTEQFLAALLSGSGDIGRYLRPGVDIAAIVPAPYAQIQLSDLLGVDDEKTSTTNPTEGSKLKVLATVELINTKDQRTTAQYALTLTARADRWEISALDQAPQVSTTTKPSATSSPSAPTPTTGPSATEEEN